MKERDIVIDIEAGCPDVSNDKLENTISFTVYGMPTSIDEFAKCENSVNTPSDVKIVKSEKKDAEKEKRFSMGAKKPPKPPRPPRGLALDAADQKLVKEISELAMIKRARIERMKALKKMKTAKASSGLTSSSGNLIAMLFTVLFCIAIIFQGCHPLRILPSNSSAVGIISSQTSNGETEGNVVGVVDQRNSFTASVHASSGFGSPSFMDLAPGLDNKDYAKKSLIE